MCKYKIWLTKCFVMCLPGPISGSAVANTQVPCLEVKPHTCPNVLNFYLNSLLSNKIVIQTRLCRLSSHEHPNTPLFTVSIEDKIHGVLRLTTIAKQKPHAGYGHCCARNSVKGRSSDWPATGSLAWLVAWSHDIHSLVCTWSKVHPMKYTYV